MRNLSLIVMLLFTGAFTNAQNTFQTTSIEILPQSQLNIIGDTNISPFECVFSTSYLQKPHKSVKYSGEESSIRFKNAVLILNTRGFDCGNRKINKDFHDLIKSDQYPEILLELNQLKMQNEQSAVANIYITIAGIQKAYQVPVRIRPGEISEYKGKLELNINDFKLTPPKKLFGLIVVKEEIEINFNLLIKHTQ